MNNDNALNYIHSNNLIGIKAGLQRPNFLEIWMVTVQGRIFARSWGFAEKSWYNTFLEDPEGQIQCGETVYNIKAIIPNDIHELDDKINEAYLTKYNRGENSKYAIAIIKAQHVEKTMEFVIVK